MSIGLGVTTTYNADGVSVATSGNKLTVPVIKPINVYRFGIINSSATDITTALELLLTHRVIAGDASSDVPLATLTPSAVVVQGDGVWFDLDARVEINPGSELLLSTPTTGASTSVTVFIEGVEYPWQHTAEGDDDRLERMTEVS